MRKYQQLFLIVVSAISIICLLMYRSENSRLKYVLEVVNFFGRSAVENVHLDNYTDIDTPIYDFIQPQPIWQRIGNGFYVYSAFWYKNPSNPGGEVWTLAVGLQHSIVRFKCDIFYENGTKQMGKFGFSREEISDILSDDNTNSIENYIIYKFRCKIQRDYQHGVQQQQPQSILFTEINSNTKHRISIRKLNGNQHQYVTHKLEIGICLNLIQNDDDFYTDSNLLQYFYHHHLIGINEIFIYDNGVLNRNIRDALIRHKISVNIFPFNFPFEIGHPMKIQRIIEIDCLFRTMGLMKFMLITQLNEFLYPDTNVQAINSFIKNTLSDYAIDVQRFDIQLDNVCINLNKKQLARNLLHKYSNNEYFPIYRPSSIIIDDNNNDRNAKNVKIDKKHVSAHRYENCDNKTEMYDWRATIGMKYLKYYDNIDMRVQALLEK